MPGVLSISPFLVQKADMYFIHGRRAPKFPKIDPAMVGALAGFLYDSLSSSLLRARTIQAVGGSPEYQGMVKTLRYIVRTEGVQGLYRGLAPLAVLGPIGTGIFFYTHHKVKKLAPKSDLTNFLSGVIGQLAGAIAWVPCATVTETRYMTEAQSKKLYWLNARGVVKHIATNKGILGFYPAFWSQNAGYCLFNGLGVLVSEKTMKWLKERQGRDLLPREIAFANFFSFGFAGAITTPIDTFKVCRQTESVTSSAKSWIGTVANMYNEGGVRRFWNGTVTRILTLAPRSAFVFSAVQYFQKSKDASQ